MNDIEGPITDPTRCPNCASYDTKKVFADETMRDKVIGIYVCRDCNIEYEVSFGNPIVVNHREP